MNRVHERPFEVSQSEYPFESRWLEHDDAVLHYVDEGKGMPVLMLHGSPTWSYLYRKVIKQLHDSCRSIAPDYPGFGFSSHPSDYGYTPQEHAEWVNALIDYLSLDKFVLVVQDWGGPIGLSVAVNRPENVAGLVICNTWCWPPNRIMRAVSFIAGGPVGKYLFLRHNSFPRRLMPMLFTRSEFRTPKSLKPYTDPFPTPASRVGTYVFPRAVGHSGEWLASIEAKLHRLADKPIELVMAMGDPLLASGEVIKHWQQHFPNASVDRIPDTGHYLQEESPDRVAAAVQRVLARLIG